MVREHIAFASFPQYPHVGPTLPVVSVLIRRGYRVSYATSSRFAQRVSALGAEVVPCEIPIYTPEEWAARGESYCDMLTRVTNGALEQTKGFYEENPPSLIIYDLVAFYGRILATQWNIPAIQTSPTFAHDCGSHSRQVKDPTFRRLLLDNGEQIARFLERFGVVCKTQWLFHREKLNIYLFPKALQPCAESVDNGCFYAGRCPGEQPYYGTWRDTCVGGRPVVLVATSTHYLRGPEYFKRCIAAFSGLKWHVILSIGDRGSGTALGPLPPHFEIVQNTSHVKILPYVDLLVCLGGIITSAEAAYHGIPMLVTTQGFPELEWQADNLAELGLGMHLKGTEIDVVALRDSAMRIPENATILRKVGQMKRIVRRDRGAEETANRIEEYLENGRET